MNGKAAIAVFARNVSSVPADIRLRSSLGERVFRQVAPGKAAYALFTGPEEDGRRDRVGAHIRSDRLDPREQCDRARLREGEVRVDEPQPVRAAAQRAGVPVAALKSWMKWAW